MKIYKWQWILYFCAFIYIFCVPCACVPDIFNFSLDILSEILFNIKLLRILSLGIIFIFLLIYTGIVLCIQIQYIPFNVNLSTKQKRLVPTGKRNYFYILVSLLSIREFFFVDHASLIFFLSSHNTLDSVVFDFTINCYNIFFILIRICEQSKNGVLFFITYYLKILSFFPSELAAFWIYTLIILLSFDVEKNPGPPSQANGFSAGFFSFCNWNINTLSKDDFYRISLLEAHNTIYNYDIISLCETSLTDEHPVPENALPGYTYHPHNHPDGTQSGGVGIFYKDTLPIRIRDDLSFDECLVTELIFGKKKIFFTVFYRNPANKLNSVEFNSFLSNFEILHSSILEANPYAMFFSGDVNGHTQAWYANGDTNAEGSKLHEHFTNLSLEQLINEPTHFFRDDCIPSCIDIILTDQPNLVLDSGVRPSLDPTVKHQITYCKFNFKIPPPPKYSRKIWHYTSANQTSIKKAIKECPWQQILSVFNPNRQVSILNETILNIMGNFIPSKMKTFRPSEPPWFNNDIRHSLKKHNKIYRNYKINGFKEQDKANMENSKKDISDKIQGAKENYLKSQGEKLADRTTGRKTYWKIMNEFLNKCKVPRIPPLLSDNIFVTNCKDKATMFNNFFAKQCTPFVTDSVLPNLVYLTSNRLTSINISANDIKSLLKILKTNKAHGPDNISATMIHLCGDDLCIPLQIIFQNIIHTGIFPNKWKEANVTPVHKKKDKQLVSNYRPISLLPLFAKIFERIVFKNLYNFFIDNNLITKNQSGFRPGDSGTNQLLSFVHEIHQAFNDGRCLEVRSVYLDLSKAFDKVWHEGLIFKLKQNGVDGNLLKLFTNYLSNRKQRVVLNGQTSDWAPIFSGVPQGSVLGPLLFLIYINDLEDGILSKIKFFADDTSLYSIVKNVQTSADELNTDLKRINDWAMQWKMSFNPDPTKPAEEILFSHKRSQPAHPPLTFNGVEVKRVDEHKHLGLILDPKLSFTAHINEKTTKARKGIGLIKHLRSYLPTAALDQIYKMHVRPHLDYCDFIFHIPALNNNNNTDINLNYHMNALESIQYQAALAITGAWKGTNRDKIYEELGWESLHNRRFFRRLTQFYKIMNGFTPQYLVDFVPLPRPHLYGTNLINDLYPIFCRNDRFQNSFFPDAVKCWNDIGPEMRDAKNISIFKSSILNLIRPKCRSIFKLHHPIGLKYIFQLRVGLSALKAHKKAHNFLDTPSDICSCGTSSESNEHYFLKCPNYTAQRITLFSEINPILQQFPNLSPHDDSKLTHYLLYGIEGPNTVQNRKILNATISYILNTGRFSGN